MLHAYNSSPLEVEAGRSDILAISELEASLGYGRSYLKTNKPKSSQNLALLWLRGSMYSEMDFLDQMIGTF